MGINSYSAAGVDIDRGDRFVEFIRGMGSRAVSRAIGGFAGGMELDLHGARHPVLLTTTDGVGTKLLVARRLRRYDTVGIDLVATCANDLAVCGAKPLLFLDYIAAGRLDESALHPLMKGIVEGCERAGCTLAGGETAEMPDLYAREDFDLAGFAVGIVERDDMLPKLDRIEAGDALLALASSGIHSNGLSLARKALADAPDSLWEELLTPTRIYVREMMSLVATGKVLAAAHVTGGGLEGNLSRVIPPALKPSYTREWSVPSIFKTIQERGGVRDEEMRRVFNMGIGVAFVVKRAERAGLLAQAARDGIEVMEIGELVGG